MKFRKIALASAGLLAVGLTVAPVGAASPGKKIAIKEKTITQMTVAGTTDAPPLPPPISDAELERIAALKSKFMEGNAAKHSELQSLHRQMEMLMTKASVDRGQAMQLQSRINAIHADLANAKLYFDLDMLDGMPADARERMRKHKLFDAAFGPPRHGAGFGGSPPPGFGPPPTCAPPPGFGPPPPFGPPPFGALPGFHLHGKGPIPGGGPGGAPPPPPPEVKHESKKPTVRYQLT